jgi:glycosyltransferase involved in cell wall biosynthesis
VKILYHHRTQAEDAQGIHIAAMVGAFRELGHEVDVCALVDAAPRSGGTGGGTALKRLRHRIPAWLYEVMSLGYNVYGYRALCRQIQARQPDLLYERYSLNTVCGILASRRFGIPLVLEVNAPLYLEQRELGELAFERLARLSERWVCSNATHTVVVSAVMRDILVREGVPASRLTVVYNGIDPREFHPAVVGAEVVRRYRLDGYCVLGFIGWFRKWHGLELILECFHEARLRERGAKLLFVGDGPAARDLRAQARAYGLEQDVVFSGPVDRTTAARHIAAFDIALQPSATAYACPMKIIEYMAMAKCIVAPDQPNIREVLDDGVTARLFAPGDRKSLQTALLELLDVPEARRTLAERAHRTVHERGFLWTANAHRVLELGGLT